jgi:hypothetical protein
MKISGKTILIPAIMAFLNCNQGQQDPVSSVPGKGSSGKAPLVIDESKLLIAPDVKNHASAALGKSASTYYTYVIGSGLNTGDLTYMMADSYQGEMYFIGPNAISGTYHLQATYSSRFTAYPENLWTASSPYQVSAPLSDYEQVEQHWFVNTTTDASRQCGTLRQWAVTIDYKVSSEANYDWLYINSTGNTCGDVGVIRKKVSGEDQGSVSFTLPANCPNAWVGAYYIKDGSLASGTDQGMIKNVRMAPMFTSCICVPSPGTGCQH